MRLSVGEIVKLAGVSARTLHYYDEIGLLKPAETSQAGYRYYDENAMARLQQILFYRELDFSLTDIQRILASPDFDRSRAMQEHRSLLIMKRDRLNALIRLTEENLEEEPYMGIEKFNETEIEKTQRQYAEEAKERWGKTDAYRESAKRTGKYQGADWERIQGEADEIFKAFAAHLDDDPASDAVQGLVEKWQKHISANYYDCTKAILSGLGQMYVCDERFTKNIDRFGDGTAQLMSEAIRLYCEK